ncbi:DUF397 domain-containing protein [Streptosporangium sp. NPDC006930]|uniref:DUF397 domain-containing protein n=1 Tax=unclassified Streptosporangium TaxID=2632669 RepID=UPI00344863F3
MDLSGAEWRKSTLSQGGGNNCVEVARNLPGIVAVRDSKAPDEPSLIFTPSEWSAFVKSIRNGQFD